MTDDGYCGTGLPEAAFDSYATARYLSRLGDDPPSPHPSYPRPLGNRHVEPAADSVDEDDSGGLAAVVL